MRALLPAVLAAIAVLGPTSTLEPKAQATADGALRDTLARTLPTPDGGAIVVLDVRSRAVVAIASGPGEDRGRGGLALPPGSVVKPFVALSLYEAGVARGPTPCPARIRLAGAPLRNHVAEDLPLMRLDEALAHSCNTVFYQLASDAWNAHRFDLATTLRAFGFGRPTGVVKQEDVGFVPVAASEREALSLSIGQGALLVSPLQLALAYNALLSGPVAHRALDRTQLASVGRAIPRDMATIIRDGTRGVVTYGTAAEVFVGSPLEVAGKTGTAVFGPRPVSWFAGWAPADAPRFIVVAAFETAGFGADIAAPAVRRVLHGLLDVATPDERFFDGRLLLIVTLAFGGMAVRGALALRARRVSRRARP